MRDQPRDSITQKSGKGEALFRSFFRFQKIYRVKSAFLLALFQICRILGR